MDPVYLPLVQQTLQLYSNYWNVAPDNDIENQLFYPANLSTDDIDFVVQVFRDHSNQIDRYNLTKFLFLANPYTYGSLVAPSFYYRLLNSAQKRESTKLLTFINLPLTELNPEVYQNSLITDTSKIESYSLRAIATLWTVIKRIKADPSLVQKYPELVPCRSYQVQTCNNDHCKNLYITCHKQIHYSEFDFEGYQPPLISQEQRIKSNEVSEMVRARDLFIEIAGAWEQQRAPNVPHTDRTLNQQFLKLILNKYKDEILAYRGFMRWYRKRT